LRTSAVTSAAVTALSQFASPAAAATVAVGLAVAVDGGVQITSTPYAIRAANATQFNGLTPDRYVQADGAGNVGIGTTTPHHRLSISGDPTWANAGWSGAIELDNGGAIGWSDNSVGNRFRSLANELAGIPRIDRDEIAGPRLAGARHRGRRVVVGGHKPAGVDARPRPVSRLGDAGPLRRTSSCTAYPAAQSASASREGRRDVSALKEKG